MLNPGDLRHRITIQQPTPGATSDLGEPAITWGTFCRRWAKIEPLTGKEAEFAKQFASTVTHKMSLWFVAGVLPTFRATYAGRTFAINASIDPDELKRELLLYCTEKL